MTTVSITTRTSGPSAGHGTATAAAGSDTTQAKVRIIHFADPWCWWSWGLEPVLARLKEVYGDELEIIYRMGGVFDDINDWRRAYGVDEESGVDWVRESVELTANPVDPDYMRVAGVTSTYESCLAYIAAAMQDTEKAHRYFRRLMEAFQVEARTPTLDELRSLAEEVGLDGKRLLSDMATYPARETFRRDMEAMRTAHVNFLSLIVEAGGKRFVGKQLFSAKPYEDQIDELVPGLPKRMPADIMEYMEKKRGHLVTTHEIAEVFQIGDEDAGERLARLEEGGMLWKHPSQHGDFWTYRVTGLKTMSLDLVRTSHVPPEAQVESEADLAPIVAAAVEKLYTQVATRPEKEYHFPLGFAAVAYVGYPLDEVAELPETAVESFAGVGFPFGAKVIRPGDVVLDIGSGSGTDVLFAATKVGPGGYVYGVDVTPAMIRKAKDNARSMGAENVQILEGSATSVPLPDSWVDVVTSNGVINLVVDKDQAFREIFRVLKPGGALQLADIVSQESVGATCGINPQLWADCIGGAAVEDEYIAAIEAAGFVDVEVVDRLDYFDMSSSDATKMVTKTFGAESIVIRARKPA